jgi:hypothetical protein
VKHLSIQLSNSAVRFTSSQNSSILFNEEFKFEDKKDYRFKEQLNSFIEASALKQMDHEEHTISWSSVKSTLVPMNIFSDSNPEQIFKLCFGNDTPSEEIDYNRLAELGIVNIFEIPLWVKSFFIIKHPRAIIQHESSMLIRGLFNTSTFKLTITITVYQGHFLLMIAKHNKLIFYSVFDFQNSEDILYHLMFTLQQKELLEENGNVIWTEGSGADQTLFETFANDFKKIGNLSGLTLTRDQEFILKSHRLCV